MAPLKFSDPLIGGGSGKLGRLWPACAVLAVLWLPATVAAMPPPVSTALEFVGADRDDPGETGWSMTLVDDGVHQLCGAYDESGKSWKFTNGLDVEIGAESPAPWNLVWAVLWSDEPQMLLDVVDDTFGADTARVETFDGKPVHCYGDDARLCVDEEIRRIVALDAEVDGVDWAIRVTGDGERLRLTEDGAQKARLAAGAQGCG